MLNWKDGSSETRGAHTFRNYKNMVALCIAERNVHTELDSIFCVHIPKEYLLELSSHFTTHKCIVVGPSTHSEDAVLVQWSPKGIKINR